MEILIQMVAFFLIWVAVDYKRPDGFRFSIFTMNGFVQFLLITIAGLILTNSH